MCLILGLSVHFRPYIAYGAFPLREAYRRALNRKPKCIYGVNGVGFPSNRFTEPSAWLCGEFDRMVPYPKILYPQSWLLTRIRTYDWCAFKVSSEHAMLLIVTLEDMCRPKLQYAPREGYIKAR